ncbi:MAG: cytochrome b [Geminicoccaceae bacterium]
MLGNTRDRWGSVQVGLHWLIAALILLQIPAGLIMVSVSPGAFQNFLFTFHKNNGLIVLILAVVRLIWRYRHPIPVLPGDMPPWQQAMARGTHAALYILLFMMPISGFLYTAYGGYPVPFLGLVDLKNLVTPDKPMSEIWQTMHLSLQWLLYLAVALHVGGALNHHLVRKDGILRRMLPAGVNL